MLSRIHSDSPGANCAAPEPVHVHLRVRLVGDRELDSAEPARSQLHGQQRGGPVIDLSVVHAPPFSPPDRSVRNWKQFESHSRFAFTTTVLKDDNPIKDGASGQLDARRPRLPSAPIAVDQRERILVMASVTNGKPAESEPLGADVAPNETHTVLQARVERWARLCKDLTARADDLRQLRDELVPRAQELDKRSLQLDQRATLVDQKLQQVEEFTAELNRGAGEFLQHRIELDRRRDALKRDATHATVRERDLGFQVAELSELRSTMHQQQERFQADRKRLDLRKETLDAQAVELERRISQLSEHRAAIEEDLKARTAQLDGRADALDEQLAELNAKTEQLNERQARLDTLAAEVEPHTLELNRRRTSLEADLEKLDILEHELDTRKGALDEREAQLDTRRTELDAETGALNAREARLDEREAQLDTHRTELRVAFERVLAELQDAPDSGLRALEFPYRDPRLPDVDPSPPEGGASRGGRSRFGEHSPLTTPRPIA